MTASDHDPGTVIIPTIETHRLTLGAPRVSDFDGYALEAGWAMRDWAFANTDLTTLVSRIDPANERAISLAKRLGGVLDEGQTDVVGYRTYRCARGAGLGSERRQT